VALRQHGFAAERVPLSGKVRSRFGGDVSVTRLGIDRRVVRTRRDGFAELCTSATKFYIAGLSIRVIAEILAWSEDQVERIIRRYVARAAATKEAIRQLNEARKRT
jgi:hypothetical protein